MILKMFRIENQKILDRHLPYINLKLSSVKKLYFLPLLELLILKFGKMPINTNN